MSNPNQWTTWWSIVERICDGQAGFSPDAVDAMLAGNVPYRQFIAEHIDPENMPGTRWRYRLRVPVEEVRDYIRAEDARRRLSG